MRESAEDKYMYVPSGMLLNRRRKISREWFGRESAQNKSLQCGL